MKQELSFIFDVDDTVYNQLDPFQLAFEENFKGLEKKISVEELYKQSRHFSDLVFAKTERGEMSLQEMRAYRITKAFASLGVSITEAQGLAFEGDYTRNLQHIQLEPAVKELLKLCCEQGIKLGIITNGAYERQLGKIRRLGLEHWIPEKHWFISGKVKLMKPDPRIFHYAEVRMGLTPRSTYYVGDSFPNDIVGASKAGWHTIWLNHRRRSVSDDSVIPDITLPDFDELMLNAEKVIKKHK